MTERPGRPIAWGVSAAEIDDAYPCSTLVPEAVAMWRGISVAAPAPVAYAWVEQLRVAPYSYDVIDNFGRRSPRTLSASIGPATPGQRFLKVFSIVDVVPGREITARATPRSRRLMGDSAITYRVCAVSSTSSRIVVRLDVNALGVVGAIVSRLLPWGDLLMIRRQLLNLAALAEANAAEPGRGGGTDRSGR